ncbi:MAG: glutathione peroxidase [Chitinophagales bacterium]|jgi:glutathione peroxidase|tara:strand:- start:1618 stop:2154 length:537 start_codon:yes stop_codon:yes gene_type:complete
MKAILMLLVGLASFNATAKDNCADHFDTNMRQLHSAASVDLCELTANKPVLVVNTASFCGYTNQFTGLEELYQQYRDKGLVIVGFPSDSFSQEAKDESETAEVCFVNFGVSFPMLATSSVKGGDANQVFKYIQQQNLTPKWNFNKYLFNSDGQLVERFDSQVAPSSIKLKQAIDKVMM